MKVLGTDMNGQPRPEEIEFGVAGFEITIGKRLLKLFQQFIQFRMIVGQSLARLRYHAIRSGSPKFLRYETNPATSSSISQ